MFWMIMVTNLLTHEVKQYRAEANAPVRIAAPIPCVATVNNVQDVSALALACLFGGAKVTAAGVGHSSQGIVSGDVQLIVSDVVSIEGELH